MKKGLLSSTILMLASLFSTPIVNATTLTLYTDYNAWLVAVNASSQNLQASTFEISYTNVLNEGNNPSHTFQPLPPSSDPNYLTTRTDTSFDGNNVNLGLHATFKSSHTGFPISFEVTTQETFSGTQARIYYNDIPQGKTPDQVDAMTDILSIGKFNGFTDGDHDWDDDDFTIEITNNDEVYGIAFDITNNKKDVTEWLKVYANKSDSQPLVVFDQGSIPGYTGGYESNYNDVRFIGVVSDTPFKWLEFNEDSNPNDIGLKNFRFATPQPQTDVQLHVNSTGTGSGSFTIIPAGLDCGDQNTICMAYVAGTAVSVTATPSSGDVFMSWSGCDSTNNQTCNVSMNAAKNVTAQFEKDADNDGIPDNSDNCPSISNPNQTNADGDSAGNLCDAFPNNPNETLDSDSDGMGDNFEQTYGLNKLASSDANLDQDGDGDTNLEEFQAGTDPTDFNSSSAPDSDNDGHKDPFDNCPSIANPNQTNSDGDNAGNLCDAFPNNANEIADTDGDGMGDNYELSHNLDIYNTADASLDADGDGLTNLQEFLGGSDPLNINDPVSQINDSHATYSGDFNGDNKDDVLWRNQNSGMIWMYLMNGTQISQSRAVTQISDLNWKIVGVGDFNADNRDDILLRNNATGLNWIYLMNGTQIIQSNAMNTISDINWKIVGVGDFNADNRDDILLRNSATGLNWIYLMNGTQIIQSNAMNTISDLNWKIVGVGDFNADNKDDVLLRNVVTGLNWIYLMNWTEIAQSGALTSLPDSNWKNVQTGDFDGDGKADIFLRNSATGLDWMYLLNGISIQASQPVDQISDIKWIVAPNQE